MASKAEFVTYVAEQMKEAGQITCRKMFGEYGVYCDGKIFGLICDNQLFIKRTEAGAALMPGCPEGEPYKGAKPCLLIEDLEDRALMERLVRATWEELPPPKPKKPKRGKAEKQ